MRGAPVGVSVVDGLYLAESKAHSAGGRGKGAAQDPQTGLVSIILIS